MFAYCLNNPILNRDYDGCIAGVDDLVIVGGVVIFGILYLTALYLSTPAGQRGLQESISGIVGLIKKAKTFLYSVRNTAIITVTHVFFEANDGIKEWAAKRKSRDNDDYESIPSVNRVGRQKGRAPRNNQNQNEQFWAIVNLLKLTYDQARQLHDEITGMGYSYQELLQIARDMFGK